MLESQPRLYVGVLTAIFAIMGWYQAMLMGGVGAAFVGSFSLLMIVATGFNLADWLSYKILVRYKGYRDAQAETERVRLVRAMSQLQEFQAALLYKEILSIVGMPGSHGPIWAVEMEGERIPLSFIESFINASEEEYLKPVRDYPDKTDQRRWSQIVTAYVVSMGFAEPARGNQSARWAHRDEAIRWFGLGAE